MQVLKFSAQDTDLELAFAQAWDRFTRSGLAREQPDVRAEWFDGAAWHVEFTVYLDETASAYAQTSGAAYAVLH